MAASAQSTPASPRCSGIGKARADGTITRAGGAAEQSARIGVAIGTGNKHPVADPAAGIGAGIDDATDRFVTGNKGIAQAREGRHGAGPQQLFGAGADPAPDDVDNDVARFHRLHLKRPQSEALRCFENDCQCVHRSCSPPGLSRLKTPDSKSPLKRSRDCLLRFTLITVKLFGQVSLRRVR